MKQTKTTRLSDLMRRKRGLETHVAGLDRDIYITVAQIENLRTKLTYEQAAALAGMAAECCTDADAGTHYVEVRDLETGSVLFTGPKRDEMSEAFEAMVNQLFDAAHVVIAADPV